MENYLTKIGEMAVLYAPKVVLAIITLIVGFWLANKLANLLRTILRKNKVDETVVPFLASIVTVVLKVLVLISVASMFGIETTSFVALIGAAGLAIGLALQGSLGHFASGVLLLVFKPYKVGDLVELAGHTGNVEEIQVFNTVLRTLDNKKIIIPNGAVTAASMVNISGQGEIRVDMQYNVSGAEDIDKVMKVVKEVADTCPHILKTPAIDILVNSQEIGITKFDVRPWCKSEHYWDVYYYMQENIKRQFVKQDVKGPKPAMDVTVNNS
jgi:small conductance mechanosensitive channel